MPNTKTHITDQTYMKLKSCQASSLLMKVQSKNYDICCSNIWRPWLLHTQPSELLFFPYSMNSGFRVMNRDKSAQENICVSLSFYILQLRWPCPGYVTNFYCSMQRQPINCRFIYSKHDRQTRHSMLKVPIDQ